MAPVNRSQKPTSKASQLKEQKQEKELVHNSKSRQRAAAQANIPNGQKLVNGGSKKTGPKLLTSQDPSIKSLSAEQLARLSELLHNITTSAAALQAEFSSVSPDVWQELIDKSFPNTPASAPTALPGTLNAQKVSNKPTPQHIQQIQRQDMQLIARYGCARVPMTPDEIESTRGALWRYWSWAPDIQTMQAAKAMVQQYFKHAATSLSSYETQPWIAARQVMWNRKGKIWELRAELDRAKAVINQMNDMQAAATAGEIEVLQTPPNPAARVAQMQTLLAELVKEDEKDRAQVIAAFEAIGLRAAPVHHKTFPVAEQAVAPTASNPQPTNATFPQLLHTPAICQSGQVAGQSAQMDVTVTSRADARKEEASGEQSEEHQKPIVDGTTQAQPVTQPPQSQHSANDAPLGVFDASKSSVNPTSGLTEAAIANTVAVAAEPKTPEMVGEDVSMPTDVVDLQGASSIAEENDADDEGGETEGAEAAGGNGDVSPLKKEAKHQPEETENGPARKKVKV